jgi:hypothetical protein
MSTFTPPLVSPMVPSFLPNERVASFVAAIRAPWPQCASTARRAPSPTPNLPLIWEWKDVRCARSGSVSNGFGVRRGVLESLAERSTRAVEAAHHGSDRNAERQRGITVLEPLEVHELDDSAETFR